MKIGAVISFSLLILSISGCGTMDDNNITAEEAAKMISTDSTLVLLDVRTPEEYAGELGHLKGAVLIPVQELEFRIADLEQYHDRKILAYCRTGRRSKTATEILRKNGFDVLNVQGGMVEWNELQLPSVEREK